MITSEAAQVLAEIRGSETMELPELPEEVAAVIGYNVRMVKYKGGWTIKLVSVSDPGRDVQATGNTPVEAVESAIRQIRRGNEVSP